MRVTPTALKGAVLIEPDVHADARGWLVESWRLSAISDTLGHDVAFVQQNHSASHLGVLRGIHYQRRRPQAKLVRVERGAVFDVAVDLRRSSATFGRWTAIVLSADNRRQMWIPAGFGHAFLAQTEGAEVIYSTTAEREAADEHAVRWDDPTLAIDWPLATLPAGAPILSARDAAAPRLADADVFD